MPRHSVDGESPPPPVQPPHPARRASDKVAGLVERLNNIEQWAVQHHDCHSDMIGSELRRFVASDEFPKAIARAWGSEEVRELFAALRDQIIGGVVSAILGNGWFRLFAVSMLLLMAGVEYKDVKELLLKILLEH